MFGSSSHALTRACSRLSFRALLAACTPGGPTCRGSPVAPDQRKQIQAVEILNALTIRRASCMKTSRCVRQSWEAAKTSKSAIHAIPRGCWRTDRAIIAASGDVATLAIASDVDALTPRTPPLARLPERCPTTAPRTRPPRVSWSEGKSQ